MKALTLLLICALATFAAHAQHLQWVSTNQLPPVFTNGSPTVSAASASDGAGTTAWLFSGSSFFPVLLIIATQQFVWLNKSGDTIFNGPVTVDGAANVSASLIRVSRNDAILQLRGAILLTNSFNILRRYVVTRGSVTFTDTPLDLTENASAAGVGFGVSLLPPPDKTGFFTFALGTPAKPEFVVRRYSNK